MSDKQNTIDLTVVIPTYNQRRLLKRTLSSLERQAVEEKKFEVLVINDGSTDGTLSLLEKRKKKSKLVFKFFSQSNKGASSARNLGARTAKGKIILFLDSDQIASKDLILEHLKSHREHKEESVVVLGQIEWHPSLEISPFMEWLKKGGPYLSYFLFKEGIRPDFKFFYTGNLSIKKSYFLKANGFDENFPASGFEDIELGYRLSKIGLNMFYNEKAISYDVQKMKLNDFKKRMFKVGKAAKILFKKHPKLKGFVSPSQYTLKKKVREILDPALFILGKALKIRNLINRYYATALFREYMKGYLS
jgi:glycosyltransferase involved in cell wall biosynthesis